MEFDLSRMPARDAYRLMVNTVFPRPIAFVTTVNRNGRTNAAPFGFFNAISFDPCMVALGLEARPDGTPKDTGQNIRDSGEFVVNLVDERLAERMNLCSIEFPADVNELDVADLTTAPSRQVRPPRIAESPVSLECRRHVTLELGVLRQIVIGEVLHIAVRDGTIDPETLRTDMDRLRLIGRAAGPAYVRTIDRFDMPRVTHEEWLTASGKAVSPKE